MKKTETAIPGVVVLEPNVHGDERGHFYESWRSDTFAQLGLGAVFVQENQSFSRRGILRGLHYQIRKPQAKLVRALSGEVFDVAVDLRRGSPTFGRWVGEILSGANHRQLYIPIGFAHGFLTLSETAQVLYKCTDYYAPEHERGVAWNDPKIGIAWPLNGITPQLNARDAGFPALADVAPENLYVHAG